MSSKQLSQIQTDVWNKLLETSSNSHFGATALTGLINESIEFAAVFIEYQRTLATVQMVQGTQTYALPTDNLYPRTAYFGDKTIAGDIKPLIIISEEALKEQFPGWLENTTVTQGRPTHMILQDRNTLAVYPRPDGPNSAAGKVVTLNYNQVPPALVNATDVPALPIPFHNIIQFYTLHLCYVSLQNVSMAKSMFDIFNEKMKMIKDAVSIETKEGLRFDWGFDDGVNIGTDIVNPS